MSNFEEQGSKKNEVIEDESSNKLRPLTFEHYIGQDHIKEELKITIEASKMKSEELGHMLFFGAPGLGKTTIAKIIANEKNANLIITSAPIIEKPADLATTLMSLEDGDILFIDEIHALKTKIEESLYSAMEDFRLDINIDRNGVSKLIHLPLKKFTLIAATTRPGAITQPLRDRFNLTHQLKFYSPEELSQILLRSAEILEVDLDKEAALEIAERSRSTARIANNILGRLRPYALVKNNGKIDRIFAKKTLDNLKIDKLGLNDMDRKMLNAMYYGLENKPVGLKAISPYISEEERTIEHVIEPFLIKKGLISKTKQGRKLTDKGVKYIKENIPEEDY